MLTKTQIKRIQKSMKNKTEEEIKISKSQIDNGLSIGKGLQVDKSRQRRSIPIYLPKTLPTIPIRDGAKKKLCIIRICHLLLYMNHGRLWPKKKSTWV